MAEKPAIPKGTRDFGPLETSRRNYIFECIRKVFRNHGYQPIETPAMENLHTLMGKYGEEGDKLLFKVLNSGDFKSRLPRRAWELEESAKLATRLSEKGLRYDLTVPFARYVVQHRNEISFPFKRFQIQPVWRADRPQRGRYREFYQCDADVVGSDSLLNEYELIQIVDAVFSALHIDVEIKLNNRKILAGIAEVIGEPERITEITVAIDKLDKIGLAKVLDELREGGLDNNALDRLLPVLSFEGSSTRKLAFLSTYLEGSETGMKGLEEINEILDLVGNSLSAKLELDLTLARGLNYYTGAIIEVKATELSMGSICGGGRYDNLTGIFGLKGLSGVGISFGADRIYDVLEQLDRFPDQEEMNTRLLFVNFGAAEVRWILPLLASLRKRGIATELYPDAAKMKKQMSYANQRGIPYVAVVGESEMEKGVISLKDMNSGQQETLSPEALYGRLSERPA